MLFMMVVQSQKSIFSFNKVQYRREKMATVKDILSIPALRKLRVIGGEQGLNKRVSYVTVMEVPDIVKWLKGNDFIITSLYAFKDDIKEQIELIDKLADARCSCLAIKTGSYVKELDKLIIERADCRGLVLVEIPSETTYIEIIVNAMDKILEDRDIDFMIEKYMKDIIFNNYDDYEIILERGKLLGFNIRDSHTLAITLSINSKATDKDIDLLRRTSKKIAKESDMLLKFTYNPVVTVGKRSTILFFTNEEKDIRNNLQNIFKMINKYINEDKLKDIKVGVGSIGKGLDSLKASYFNSLEVLKLGKVFKTEEFMYLYDELKVYLVLEKFLRENGHKIFDDIYREMDDELLLTLETFYSNNMDIVETGKELFIHKNTVRYRLKKIKDITGYDTSIFEHNFNLYLFLLYTKIKH